MELRGDEVQQVNHAYGTNGIITQLEIPLAPAYPWAEIIVTFDDFMKMDIRVGEIIAAEKHPDADKLLKITVNTGLDQRTVVSIMPLHSSP